MERARIPLGVLLALVLWFGGRSCHAATLAICAEPEPPPWIYWQRDGAGRPTKILAGFTVELVTKVFQRIGVDIVIRPEPWMRCRQSLLSHKADFSFDAYPDDFPQELYVLSRHYNSLTTKVFFDAMHPVEASRASDLKSYRGCGLSGSSYKSFHLEDKDLDLDAKDDAMLVRKLFAGRCDYFIEDLEVMAGNRLGGQDFLSDPRLRGLDIPDAKPGTLHIVAKRGTRAAAMMPAIDKAITALIESGEAAMIWKKHAGSIVFKP